MVKGITTPRTDGTTLIREVSLASHRFGSANNYDNYPNPLNKVVETGEEEENEENDNENNLFITTSTLPKHVQLQIANTPPNKTIHPIKKSLKSSNSLSLLDVLKRQSLSNKSRKKSINQSSTKVVNFQNRIIAICGDVIKSNPLTPSLIHTIGKWSEYINKLVIIGDIEESVLELMKNICDSIMIYSEDEFISFFKRFYYIFFNFYFYNCLASDFLYSIDVFLVLDTKTNNNVYIYIL